ncbi:hypothetical protein [Blastochloris tepida]|jgi:hypothetical protein|uniref:Uncharacterized protein n=1 Tax=Blastochloris tepida TaxID=2233851 RepID=A0A348G1U4_9HYPH|nr:hypothetical protein [Blastochloris tepida]BBF93527.1 hypothetical protein BLTE_22120 [Blastochloris tepida]
MSEYDTLFRFDDATDLAEMFPCREAPRPPAWRVGERIVLGPLAIAPPVVAVADDGLPVYAYDPAEAILEGVYAVVTTNGIDEALWENPEAIVMRNRDTGVVIRQRTTNDVDLPMCISPVWAGMQSEFVLPAA